MMMASHERSGAHVNSECPDTRACTALCFAILCVSYGSSHWRVITIYVTSTRPARAPVIIVYAAFGASERWE